MSLLNKINRMEKLHALIHFRKSGTPEQLAERLGISRSCLYNLIEELKVYNLPISYSRSLQTFFYKQEIEFAHLCKVEIIEDKSELGNINGGSFQFFLPSSFIGRKESIFAPVSREYKESAHRLIRCGKKRFQI
jgi:hypothetical protein